MLLGLKQSGRERASGVGAAGQPAACGGPPSRHRAAWDIAGATVSSRAMGKGRGVELQGKEGTWLCRPRTEAMARDPGLTKGQRAATNI